MRVNCICLFHEVLQNKQFVFMLELGNMANF